MKKSNSKIIYTIIGVFVFTLLYFGYGIYTVNKTIKVNELNTEGNTYPVTSNAIVSKDESKLVFVRDTGDHRPSDFFAEGIDNYNQLVILDIATGQEEVLLKSGNIADLKIANLPQDFPINILINIGDIKFSTDESKVYFTTSAWATSGAVFSIGITTREISYIGPDNARDAEGKILVTTDDIMPADEHCDPLLSGKICNYLSVESYWVDDVNIVDVTGDGISDYLVEVVGAGCGSCHARSVLFFQNDKLYFQYDGDDASIFKADTIKNGLVTITEPIRKDSEALCCPSSYKEIKIQCRKLGEDIVCEEKK
jgi:hypothetical protein